MEYYKFKNCFELEKYDDLGNCIESYNYDQSWSINMKAGIDASKKREDYLARGYTVLKEDQHKHWKNLVCSSVYGENCWVNAGIIEAVLAVMEDLSNGKSVEDAYKHIDIDSEKPIYNHLFLSGTSAWKASDIVATVHERGKTFADYRNKIIKNGTITDESPKTFVKTEKN